MQTNGIASFVRSATLSQDAQTLLAAVLEKSMNPWMLIRVKDKKICYLNPKMRTFLGKNANTDINDFEIRNFIREDQAKQFEQNVLLQTNILGSWQGTINLADLSGGDYPARVSTQLFKDTSTHDSYYAVEATLLSSNDNSVSNQDNDLLRELMSVTPFSIYFKDRQSRFLRTSLYQAKKFGLDDPVKMIGKTDFDYFTIEHASQAFEDEKRIIETQTPILDIEEKETYADGRVHWVSTSKFPLRSKSGDIIGTFGISRDISAFKQLEEERKEMEIQRNLSQKLESIGRLASGVAHEINTPSQFVNDNVFYLNKATTALIEYISAIDGIVELTEAQQKLLSGLKQRLGIANYAKEIPITIQETIEGIERISKIVSSLKEFAHPSKSSKVPANLNRIIETTINVARHEWKYVADLTTTLTPDLPLVNVRPDEIGQVLLNLIVNASHAIADRNKADHRSKGKISITSAIDQGFVIISVEDNGAGMTESVKSNIFVPFFTTKEVGKGTGQGLAMVRKIISQNHNGIVDFNSEYGSGTKFTVKLPISD